jgi:hypothetical protein
MAFPFDIREMWNKAFRQSGSNTKIAVQIENTTPILVDTESGIVWDEIEPSYPDNTTEIYTYKLLGSTVQTVTVSYSNASKKQLSGVTKVVV